MLRFLVSFFLTIFCFVLQSTVFPAISFGGIVPNLMIVLTASFGFMRGEKSGLLFGFFCGLLTDIFFNTIIGFNALIYLWVGYFSGNFYRIFYDDDIKTPLFLISVSDIVYGIVQYGFLFLMRGRIHFFYYLGRIILPEMLYTLILTFVVYQILYAINKKLCMTDRGGTDSFVS